ncbi:MAG: GtrA family protein [Clostridiales bacterium]|jgi:putative flippase GtrA|nr:GtrA family protein [Clostridiales bacterium]
MKDTKAPKLSRRQNIIQAVKFTIFSASAGIIQIGTFTLLERLTDLSYWAMYLPALILSVIYNFTINRRFTFKSANNVPVAMLKVLCYYLVITPLSTWWGDALTKGPGWNEYLVLIGTMLINFITEFLFDRFFVFGKSINTNELGIKENEREAQLQKK